MKVTTVGLLLFVMGVCCNAQSLKLRRTIDVTTPKANGTAIRSTQRDSTYMLVHLADARKINVQIHVVRNLGEGYAIVTKSQAEQNRQMFLNVTTVNYLWKLSNHNLFEDKGYKPMVVKCVNEKFLLEQCDRNAFICDRQGTGVFSVYGEVRSVVDALAPLDAVSYIGMESMRAQEESTVLDLNLNPNAIRLARHRFPSINGSDKMISVKERHYRVDDIDLREKHVSSGLGSPDTTAHATDMATIIAGSGNSFVTGLGVATHAQITSSGFENLFPDDPSVYTNFDVTVQNHSYGTVIESEYGALAEAYDVSANQNPNLLHVFSSGNVGDQAATAGVYAGLSGFANLTGNAKMSKNTLTVGSVDTTGHVIALSSAGPAHDGRVKPELVAYSMAGTSNSAAMVSGVAALAQQALEEFEHADPESALVKAILINSAHDVGAPHVDFKTGFGNLDAYRALETIHEKRFKTASLIDGHAVVGVAVPAGAINFKATLVWNDLAAHAGDAVALVNDLDMKVTSGSELYLPWVLNTSANSSSLSAHAVRGTDHINNVEQITVENPSTSITISVDGPANSFQQFSVAWQWEMPDSFAWYYPSLGDNFPYNGETGTYFYWHSSRAETTGALDVSFDNGLNWTTLSNSVELSRGYYRWNNPPLVNSNALARMRIGGEEFQTERFVISRPVLPSIGFNCGDSVLLQWRAVPEATSYRVYALRQRFLDPILTTPDTTLIFKKNQAEEFHSIEPILSSGDPILRSHAISHNVYGVGCFILSFVDEVVPEEGVRLKLDLSTTYGIGSVRLERETKNGFQALYETGPPSSRDIAYLDEEPGQGLNRYRATLVMNNDQIIESEIIENWFLTRTSFIVFPNPVRTGNELRIFSRQFANQNFQLTIYRTDGTELQTQSLQSDREFILMDQIKPGLYVYSIKTIEGVFTGKLIVSD